MFKCTRRTLAGIVLLLFAAAHAAAQPQPAAAPSLPPGPGEPAPKDLLGRDTPRGAVLGCMDAARRGNNDVTPLYLDAAVTGDAAVELARKLFVVLDSRLTTRVNELSDRPEGTLANPLKPNMDVIATLSTSGGS